MPGLGVGAGVATGGAALAAAVAAGDIPGAGDSSVTGTEAPGLANGCVPGAAGDMPGAAGDMPGIAGVVIGGKLAPGDTSGGAGTAGVVAGGGASCEAGAVAVGDWPKAVNVKAVAQTQAVNSVFIVEIFLPAQVPVTVSKLFIPKRIVGSPAKLFTFLFATQFSSKRRVSISN